MKRQAASLKIQKNYRRHLFWMSYDRLKHSSVVLQTGLRAMAAHKAFRYKKTTKAALLVQVSIYLDIYMLRFKFKLFFFLFYSNKLMIAG